METTTIETLVAANKLTFSRKFGGYEYKTTKHSKMPLLCYWAKTEKELLSNLQRIADCL